MYLLSMNKIFLCIVFISQFNFAQNDLVCNENESKKFQIGLNEHYGNPEKSPLKDPDLENFENLKFFEINLKFCFQAKFVRTPIEQPFEMLTTTDRKPLYLKYGEIHFEYENKTFILEAYKQVPKDKALLYNKLFVPFTDLTSGNESYGGGRYLDIEIPEGNEIILDFNKAYNPYCAYNEKYSCPLVPEVNDIKIEIKAGVKKFKD